MQGERLEVVKTFKDGVSLREVMASASPKSAPGAAAAINAGTCYSRHFWAVSARDTVHASSLSYNHHSRQSVWRLCSTALPRNHARVDGPRPQGCSRKVGA